MDGVKMHRTKQKWHFITTCRLVRSKKARDNGILAFRGGTSICGTIWYTIA